MTDDTEKLAVVGNLLIQALRQLELERRSHREILNAALDLLAEAERQLARRQRREPENG